MSFRSHQFASEPENLASVRALVREFLREEGIPAQPGELLVLGVDEACSNIIRHAYRGEPGRPIALECECDGAGIRFRLRDWGIPADPAGFKSRSSAEIKPGGLGLSLIRRIFDEAVYTPLNPGTELRLLKRFPLTLEVFTGPAATGR